MIGIGIGVPRFRNAGGGTPPALLLDTYSGATAAYSLRQLSTSYSDPVITLKVLDGGANPEHPISFSNGVIDTAQIEQLCGPFEGVVAQWWDQSGNNFHAYQPQGNVLSMPKIYEVVEGVGSVITKNNKPSIRFDANDILGNNLGGLSTKIGSVFGVVDANNNNGYFYGNWGLLSPTVLGVNSEGKQIVFFGSALTGVLGASGQILSTFIFNNDFGSLYLNSQFDNSGGIGNRFAEGISIGGWDAEAGGQAFWNDDIQELVFYNSEESTNRSGIETNINSYYNIYP